MNFKKGRFNILDIHKIKKVIRAKIKVLFHPDLRLKILVNKIADNKIVYRTSTQLTGNRGMIKMANIKKASCNI